MPQETRKHLLIVGVGGLGSHMVREALGRGHRVSVLVRDDSNLEERVGAEAYAQLERIIVGDATDPMILDTAMQGVDAVLSGNGAHQKMARELAHAVARNTVDKLCWPAGGTNLMAEDGTTPAYRAMGDTFPAGEQVYRAHQVCIDEIRAAGITFVILCPGRMEHLGHRSPDVRSAVRINRPVGMFTSYEDAAWVMVEGAVTHAFDNELVGVSTTPQSTPSQEKIS